MATGRRSVWSKLLKRHDGAVAAEFALVAPLFFSFVLGGLEYGTIIYSMSSMQLAASVAARDIAVNNLSSAQAQARMAPYLPGWLLNDVSLTLTESHPDQPRINTVTVRLEAEATDAAVLALFSRAIPWTVVAEANVQMEMPFNNAVVVDDDDDD